VTQPLMAAREAGVAPAGPTGAVKRLLVGRKLRSSQMGQTLLPKCIALPVFASDPLSSVAPLEMLDSPYRQVVSPVVGYVKAVRRAHPRGVVAVYVPEYVAGHWWERLLHNQGAFRIKAALILQPGVVITSVPYQLRSAGRGGG
jgi:hypothetical protein